MRMSDSTLSVSMETDSGLDSPHLSLGSPVISRYKVFMDPGTSLETGVSIRFYQTWNSVTFYIKFHAIKTSSGLALLSLKCEDFLGEM